MDEWVISNLKIIIYSDFANDYKMYLLEKIVKAYEILKEVERELD